MSFFFQRAQLYLQKLLAPSNFEHWKDMEGPTLSIALWALPVHVFWQIRKRNDFRYFEKNAKCHMADSRICEMIDFGSEFF